MKVSPGYYFSPDVGRFVATDTHLYFSTGEVWENEDNGYFFRCMGPMKVTPENDYSKWSGAHRAAMLKETEERSLASMQAQVERDTQEFHTLTRIKSAITAEDWAYIQSRFEYEPECGWPE